MNDFSLAVGLVACAVSTAIVQRLGESVRHHATSSPRRAVWIFRHGLETFAQRFR